MRLIEMLPSKPEDEEFGPAIHLNIHSKDDNVTEGDYGPYRNYKFIDPEGRIGDHKIKPNTDKWMKDLDKSEILVCAKGVFYGHNYPRFWINSDIQAPTVGDTPVVHQTESTDVPF